MTAQQILPILYEISLVIGSQERLSTLLNNTLLQFIKHTGYQCGFILLKQNSRNDNRKYLLKAVVGDTVLANTQRKSYELPPNVQGGQYTFSEFSSWMGSIPLRENFYHGLVVLEIPGIGYIFLMSHSQENSMANFSEIFLPVLSNFAKSIRLVRINERSLNALTRDRNRARKNLLRFREALDSSADYIFLIHPRSQTIADSNLTVLRKLGYSVQELKEKRIYQIVDLSQIEWTRYYDDLMTGRYESIQRDTIIKRADGSEIAAGLRLTLLQRKNISPVLIAVFRDIRERVEMEKKLHLEKEKIMVTLRSIGDGVITINLLGEIDYMNSAAEAICAIDFAEAAGRVLSDIIDLNFMLEAGGKPPGKDFYKELRQFADMKPEGWIADLKNRDGQIVPVEITTASLFGQDEHVFGYLLVFRDVTESRSLSQMLSWQASHDPLTGLANRREFEKRLEEALTTARRTGRASSMLYLDLDQFKIVNDTCGHAAGDELLRQLSSRLHMLLMPDSILARLGGDEFGVIMPGKTIDDALIVAQQILSSVAGYRYEFSRKPYQVGVSIGIAPIESHFISTVQIMSMADIACYTAKELGRNRCHVFVGNDREYMKKHAEMKSVSGIKRALEKGELLLYRQAIASTNNPTDIEKYEILLKMKDEATGVIRNAADFISGAEKYNLMPEIDRWVIENVFCIMKSREPVEMSQKAPCYAINLSGATLNDSQLFIYIREKMREYNVVHHRISFEVTENTAVSHFTNVSVFMREMKAMGCTFSLDDFGTGLSSFSYLRNLPVDTLKIDGSFIQNVLNDPIDRVMLESIHGIGHKLGLKTVAEYIESPELLEIVREIGIDFVQGFAIHKPEPFI